jgi:hypothetical protein
MPREWAYPYFDIDGLSSERLLATWRWFCPQAIQLVAVDAFGDLFLEDAEGLILRLNCRLGQLERIANNRSEFRSGADKNELRQEWFEEDAAIALAEKGFPVFKGKCIGYKTPIVFREASASADNTYIAGIEEYVAFLGDLHSQLTDVPDGGRVRIIIGPEPGASELESEKSAEHPKKQRSIN